MTEPATRWLLMGAAGQLGRSVLAIAPKFGANVTGLTRADLDICDGDAVERALDRYRPDIVLNAAAYTQVDRAESEAGQAWQVNAEAPAQLARLCSGRARLFHVSTDYVFAGREGEVLDEESPTEPLSSYGRSKLAGEAAVAEFEPNLVIRTQWLFGPGPCFVRAILRRAEEGGDIRVVRDEVGQPTWTGTLARALFDVALRPIRGTLHVANRGVTDRYEFARAIVAEGARRGWNRAVAVEPILHADLDLPARRPVHAVLDLGKAERAGLELPTWQDALAGYLDAEEEKRDA